MKIRQGFVSNSSSSSFLMLVDREQHEEALRKLTRLHKEVVEYVTKKEIELFGHKVLVLGWVSGNYSSLEDFSVTDEAKEEVLKIIRNEEGDDFEEDCDDDYVSEAIYDSLDEYKKVVNPLFSTSQDM